MYKSINSGEYVFEDQGLIILLIFLFLEIIGSFKNFNKSYFLKYFMIWE